MDEMLVAKEASTPHARHTGQHVSTAGVAHQTSPQPAGDICEGMCSCTQSMLELTVGHKVGQGTRK